MAGFYPDLAFEKTGSGFRERKPDPIPIFEKKVILNRTTQNNSDPDPT